MKRILIVGVGGFIGKNLREYLKDKYILYTPASTELDAADEMQVKSYLTEHFFDVVIHAGIYNPRTDKKKDANRELEYDLRMYYNFEKYQSLYGKMLYFGSGAEFDKRKDICSVKENDLPNGVPVNDYGFAKYVIGKSIENSENIYNLRVFGLFGKYENWKAAFISNACCKAIKGLPISIRQNTYFDYLYIDDFCRIVEWFIEHTPQYKTYNVASGEKVDLRMIAEKVIEISGKNIPVFICKDGLGKEYTADNTRLKEEVDISQLQLDESIKLLYEWYNEQEEEIDLESLLYQ